VLQVVEAVDMAEGMEGVVEALEEEEEEDFVVQEELVAVEMTGVVEAVEAESGFLQLFLELALVELVRRQ